MIVEFNADANDDFDNFHQVVRDECCLDVFLISEPVMGKSAECVDFGKLTIDFNKILATFTDENTPQIILPVYINDLEPNFSDFSAETPIGDAKVTIFGLKKLKCVFEK